MSIQVLVATMNQSDFSLLDKMNIQTDAIVGNQCMKNEVIDFKYNNRNVKWLSFFEKGVGLNRANADIVTFADDDMVFLPNYENIILNAFTEIKDADVIIFDLRYPKNPRKPITRIKKLSSFKAMRFGAARISARLNSLRINGISFNLCFGGGAQYGSGEDSLFLMECFRKGLKIYSYPAVIAELIERKSTWFNGYNDKFFFDKGILFSQLYPKLCVVYALIHCYKQKRRYSDYGCLKALKKILEGIKHMKSLNR